LDVAVNVAMLAVACLLAVVLVKQFLLGDRGDSIATLKVGEELRIPRSGEQSDDRTLVLALSTNCHFCSESAPFYQNVLSRLAARKVRVVAVFPQSTSEASEYLKRLNLQIPNVQQVNFRQVRVPGTPTLILLDQHSVVTNVWVGKLMSEQEAEVLSKL
jgi:hypothetical protein